MVQMKRHTSSAKNRRRSQLSLKPMALNKCPKCGKTVEPHKACRFCGSYRANKAVVTKASKVAKKIKK